MILKEDKINVSFSMTSTIGEMISLLVQLFGLNSRDTQRKALQKK